MGRRDFLKFGALIAFLGLSADPVEAAVKRSSKIYRKSKQVSRALYFYNPHTGEKLDVSYFTKGRYSSAAMKDINRIFRDHRTGAIKPIDHKLLDYLYALSDKLETPRTPFHIISGYRSPETNALLSRQSAGVAKDSFHIKGKAVDIRLPGRTIASVRNAAVSLKAGGVGYYPEDQFVHIDVGDIRCW
ncbi:MAG: YcbK family protein [Desulfatirhabdiaceae bacterium]